jgi:hypothetical protein
MCRGASAAKRLSRTHGLLRGAFERAGFREVVVEIVPSDQRFPSLDSLPEMRPILDQIREASRDAMWQEIEMVMRQFEQSDGVIVPTERLVAVGTKSRDQPSSAFSATTRRGKIEPETAK